VQQELTLDSDNTGRFKLYLSLPLATYTTWIADPASPLAPALAPWFDPAKGAARLTEADGFHVTTYRLFARGDRQYLHIEGTLTNLDKALTSGHLGNWTLSRDTDNVSHLQLRQSAASLLHPSARSTPDLASLTQGVQVKLVVAVPGHIVATTAPDALGKSEAVWSFDSTTDPHCFAKQPLIDLSYR